MNGTDNNQGRRHSGDLNDPLAELFRHASARQRPPAGDEQIVRQALHEQWEAMTRGPRARRKVWPWAIAASVLLAVVVGTRLSQVADPIAPAQQVALADRIMGQITLQTDTGSRNLHEAQEQWLLSGQTIRLGANSRLAMRWINGAAIRMDERTELKLISPDELFLDTGRIYVDTADADHTGAGITVHTPQGVVRHLGTQFMTQVSPSGTAVSVREGQVAYFPSPDRVDERTLAIKGQKLAVAASGGIAIEPIAIWGDEWVWAEQMSTGFASDGRSLADLLAWAARESGRQVEYRSLVAESVAVATILHGDLELQPMQVLSVANATSDLRAEVEDGLIVVHLQSME